MQNSLIQKQIPTLLGIGVLIVGIVLGVLFFNQNLSEVFLPRAAPTATPKNVKVTNLKDNSFTVSFITDDATIGFVKYGTTANDLDLQAGDDRDQASGSVGQFTTHHITVRDLEPSKTYYYTIGTTQGSAFDNDGTPFTVTTGKNAGTPPAAKTAYGTVMSSSGTPADGAIVYIKHPNAGEMSNLTKNSGTFTIPLSLARTPDGTQYATMAPTDELQVFVQGLTANDTSVLSLTVEDAQPIATITLGQSGQAAPSEDAEDLTATDMFAASPSPVITTASGSGDLGLAVLPASPSAEATTVVDLTAATPQVVETTQPVIVGEAPPNTKVSIEIHSETQIQTELTTDENGDYEIDLAQLQQDLEPGEHTVTITYTDPATGKKVTQTKTFTVETPGTGGTTANSTLLAQANTTGTGTSTSSNQPFGTGNPFTLTSPTPTSTASASVEPRVSMPSTGSNLPQAGSFGTTLAVFFGGVFLIGAGIWSYFSTKQTYLFEERKET